MDFYIEITEDKYQKAMIFDQSLGMWFWNMAVMIAPYDTGNLRRSITLKKNSVRNINIQYNTMRANYIKFLEEGIGPVKKHTGFIGVNTRLAIVEQLIMYLKTGKKPLFTAQPYVALRNSKSVFPSEKAFLRNADMNVSSINANTRRKISMIRETAYRREHGRKLSSFSGQKVLTGKMQQDKIKANSKGISTLHQMYIQAKG